MKKLLLAFSICIMAGTAVMAQVSPAQKKAPKQTTATAPAPAPTATTPAPAHVKKDGTVDKRYHENKHLKKDGTPDKRYKGNK